MRDWLIKLVVNQLMSGGKMNIIGNRTYITLIVLFLKKGLEQYEIALPGEHLPIIADFILIVIAGIFRALAKPKQEGG